MHKINTGVVPPIHPFLFGSLSTRQVSHLHPQLVCCHFVRNTQRRGFTASITPWPICSISRVSFDNSNVSILAEDWPYRRGIWREHSSKKWLRPRFSVDLIKGLQMSRAKPKLTQIFRLSSGVPLTFFSGTIFVGIVV
jgi:hypothetical protein